MPCPTLRPPTRGSDFWKPVLTLVAIVLALAEAKPPVVLAQEGSSRPVLVALPESFPAVEARSLIVRTPEQDVIVLRADDTMAEALMMAMSLLEGLRAEDPMPEAGQLIPITGFAVRRPPSAPRQRDAESVVRRLRGAPATRIGDLGPGRWIPLPG